MLVTTTRLRRSLTAVAATGLLAGLLPVAASAATPAARDITDFACPADEVPDPGFTDDDSTVHEAAIACIVWYDLAGGITSTKYGPDQDVRRDQMATFIANLLEAGGVALPSNPPDAFVDDESSVHELAINQLAALGVVNGTSASTYSPGASVRRDQMATFLNNAYEEITGTRLTSSQDYFTDDESSVHEQNINAVAGAGLAAGKTATTYRPLESVLRDQMASFLARETDLLVEEGDITKPETTAADVVLSSTTVFQGGMVKGKVVEQDGTEVTSMKVSGCGVASQTVPLTGADNAFEFAIPVTQPTGLCTLSFTMTQAEGDDLTDTEKITVTSSDDLTAAPELVSAAPVGDPVDGKITIRFTFDEALNQTVAPLASAFRLYDAEAARTVAESAAKGPTSTTVDAVFPASAYTSATTLTVAAAAVEDGSGVANTEGALPKTQAPTTRAGTDAPDLKSAARVAGTGEFVFTYDQAVVSHPGTAGDYHLVFADGTTADGDSIATVGETDPKDQRNVTFTDDLAGKTIVRAYVDADTVSNEAQDGNALNGLEGATNPTQAVDVSGGGDSPYLTKVVIDAANNTVTYTFNRGVALVSKSPLDSSVFLAYDEAGEEVGTNSATVSGAVVTATFSGSTDPITSSTVGASVLANAVRATSGTQKVNQVDSTLPPSSGTVPGNAGGETAAPDLVSVARSVDGSDSVLTFTFDAPVSAVFSGGGDLVIYSPSGARTELDLNETNPASNECSVSGNTVVCSAASTSTLGQAIDAATLGAVEYSTVSSGGTSPKLNYEASAPIAD